MPLLNWHQGLKALCTAEGKIMVKTTSKYNLKVNIHSCETSKHKYEHEVMVQHTKMNYGLSEARIYYWGGSYVIHIERQEQSCRIIEDICEELLERSRICNIKQIGIIFYVLGYGLWPYSKVFEKYFIEHAQEDDDLEIDIINRIYPYNLLPKGMSKEVNSILYESQSALPKEQTIVEKAKPESYPVGYPITEQKPSVQPPAQKNPLDADTINEILTMDISDTIDFARYLDELFRKRAEEEIDEGRFPISTTREKAVNNWIKQFDSNFTASYANNPSLISRIKSGNSLKKNRRILMCMALKLHLSIDETHSLMRLGKLSLEPESKYEKLLLYFIEKEFYDEMMINEFLYKEYLTDLTELVCADGDLEIKSKNKRNNADLERSLQ